MALYHFTDERNLWSIQRRGLLSWRALVDRGINHYPGSSDLSRRLDERDGLDNFVRLCLNDVHPMAFCAVAERRIVNLVWLMVDDHILNFAALFSDKNATANGAIVDEDPSTALDSNDQQAEVLVPGFVAARWISFPS